MPSLPPASNRNAKASKGWEIRCHQASGHSLSLTRPSSNSCWREGRRALTQVCNDSFLKCKRLGPNYWNETVLETESSWKVMEPHQDVIKGAAPQQEREIWHDRAGAVTGRHKTVLCLYSNELRLLCKMCPFTCTLALGDLCPSARRTRMKDNDAQAVSSSLPFRHCLTSQGRDRM